MTLSLASSTQLATIRKLLSTARYVYKNVGDEDLRLLVESGVVVLADDQNSLWGALGIALEERPATLPTQSPSRAGVSMVGFLPGYWPSERIPLLMSEAERLLQQNRLAVTISGYGQTPWLEQGLLNAGFEIVDRIVCMALDRIHLLKFDSPQPSPANLRPAAPADLGAVAKMDATAFEALWHFGERQLWELLWRGRVQVAEVNGEIVGYSALLNNSKAEAQLARLAVAPTQQGRGIGHYLLIDTIHSAQQLGYRRIALNTQLSNLRSQTLYTQVGFRPFGDKLAVLTKTIQ